MPGPARCAPESFTSLRLSSAVPATLRPAELHIAADGAPGLTFVRSPYVVETSDAERIGVDQVRESRRRGA